MRFTLVFILLLATFARAQGSSPKDKKFASKVLAAARSYIEANDFDQAVATLTSAVAAQAQAFVDPSESTPLLSKLAEVYGFISADAVEQKAIPVLTQLYGQNGWAVKSALEKSSHFQSKLGNEAALMKPVIGSARGVTSPRLLSKVEPTYAEAARKARYEGTVILKIVVGPEGAVRETGIIMPLGLGLDEKAIEAVSKWLFEPGTKDGKPVAVVANLEVNFHLL